MAQNYTDLQRDRRKGHFTGFPTNVPGTPDTVIPDDPEGIVSTLPSLIENVNVVAQDPQNFMGRPGVIQDSSPLMDPARFLTDAGYPTIATGPAAGMKPSVDEDFLRSMYPPEPNMGHPPFMPAPVGSVPTAVLKLLKSFPGLMKLFQNKKPSIRFTDPRRRYDRQATAEFPFREYTGSGNIPSQPAPFMGGVSGLPIGSKGYKQQQLNRFRRQQTNNPIVDEYLKRTRNVTPPSAGERQITNPALLERARRSWGTPTPGIEGGSPIQQVPQGGLNQPNLEPSIMQYFLSLLGAGGAASQSPEIEEFLNQTKRRQDPIR